MRNLIKKLAELLLPILLEELIKELEKVTKTDLNQDGKIEGDDDN